MEREQAALILQEVTERAILDHFSFTLMTTCAGILLILTLLALLLR